MSVNKQIISIGHMEVGMRNFIGTLLLGAPSKADFRDFLAQCKEFAHDGHSP